MFAAAAAAVLLDRLAQPDLVQHEGQRIHTRLQVSRGRALSLAVAVAAFVHCAASRLPLAPLTARMCWKSRASVASPWWTQAQER